MNPIALVLLLVGYSLALPIASKMREVVRTQNRLAITGHQAGLLIAATGWVVGGRPPLIWVHLLWAIAAIIWFNWVGGRAKSRAQP